MTPLGGYGSIPTSGCFGHMRRSSSFPGAALDDIATNKLTSSLTAQLVSPAVPQGPSLFASSGDLDSESFADDWTASDEISTPSRCVDFFLCAFYPAA